MDSTEYKLKRPFDPKKLSWRPGGGGKQLAYITRMDVVNRLNEVVGADGWQCHMKPMGGARVACELSLKINGEWITKTDGAGETQIEGEKGVFADALKRAASLFGVGAYLYHLKNAEPHNLPKWATPEGFDELMGPKQVEEFFSEEDHA